jgi:hypothetical protein
MGVSMRHYLDIFCVLMLTVSSAVAQTGAVDRSQEPNVSDWNGLKADFQPISIHQTAIVPPMVVNPKVLSPILANSGSFGCTISSGAILGFGTLTLRQPEMRPLEVSAILEKPRLTQRLVSLQSTQNTTIMNSSTLTIPAAGIGDLSLSGIQPTVTPEPSTIAILLMGILSYAIRCGLKMLRRR